jgi:glycine/D-amino acid oxidase-like deaminating enzyme
VRVVVVGAGVVGASVAYALVKLGVDVVVLEASHPAAGTTSSSFAWANANEKAPRAYFELNLAGLRAHHALAAELGGGWWQATGNLEISANPPRRDLLRRKVDRLRQWGYSARTLERGEAAELAPDLMLGKPADYAFFPEEGWVAGPVLVAALLHAARKFGGQVSHPRRVTGLDLQGREVTGVLVDGERIPADAVVDCAGASAGVLLEERGLSIRRRRSPGLLVITSDVATNLERTVHLDDLHLRPDGAGRLRAGAGDLDDQIPSDGVVLPESPLVREILRRATRVMPILGTARVEAVKVGWRPLPFDGLSAVGPISGLAGYYLVFTHSGITLGPHLGSVVASELTSGVSRPELQPFRPDRLIERA